MALKVADFTKLVVPWQVLIKSERKFNLGVFYDGEFNGDKKLLCFQKPQYELLINILKIF